MYSNICLIVYAIGFLDTSFNLCNQIMKKILIINASARSLDSQSRKLTDYFTGYLKTRVIDKTIIYRDLGNSEIPHISRQWIEADIKSDEERTSEEQDVLMLSDQYIKELHDTDIIILATPMYNWSIPSTLKAYIDQVMRLNKIFIINTEKGKQRYQGLLKEKNLVFILSRGSSGYEVGERNEYMNFQNTYLKFVFGIMGIQNLYEISINGTSKDPAELKMEMKKAEIQIENLVDKLFYEKQ